MQLPILRALFGSVKRSPLSVTDFLDFLTWESINSQLSPGRYKPRAHATIVWLRLNINHMNLKFSLTLHLTRALAGLGSVGSGWLVVLRFQVSLSWLFGLWGLWFGLLIPLRLVSKRVLWNGVKVRAFDLCEPKLKFFAFEEVYLCATQGLYFLRVVIFINTQDLWHKARGTHHGISKTFQRSNNRSRISCNTSNCDNSRSA
jgi:hypothetical protein